MPDLLLALFAVIPLAIVELAKAARWRALFGAERPSYLICLRALVSGQVTNAFSPVRAGEAVRLGVLAAQGGPLVQGTGALAGAKAIDTVCLGAIASAVAGTTVLTHPTWGLLAGACIIAAGVALALRGSGLRARLEQHRITRKLRLAALVDVAQALRDPRVLVTVALATLTVWGVGLLANAVILAAVGVPPTLNLMARIIVAGYLVSLLPSPPAQIGTFEAAVTVALTTAGVATEHALAASITLHVCQIVKLGALTGISVLLSLTGQQRVVKWVSGIRRPVPPVRSSV